LSVTSSVSTFPTAPIGIVDVAPAPEVPGLENEVRDVLDAIDQEAVDQLDGDEPFYSGLALRRNDQVGHAPCREVDHHVRRARRTCRRCSRPGLAARISSGIGQPDAVRLATGRGTVDGRGPLDLVFVEPAALDDPGLGCFLS
jgi:hypothetical protein